jgi:hypothetical protein
VECAGPFEEIRGAIEKRTAKNEGFELQMDLDEGKKNAAAEAAAS